MNPNQSLTKAVRSSIRPLGSDGKPVCSWNERLTEGKIIQPTQPGKFPSFVGDGTWSCKPNFVTIA